MPPAHFMLSSKNIPPIIEYQNSIQTGYIIQTVCCFFWGCFCIDFPSVACFRCRRRPLYRRERGKVFGLNTLCPQRKILPETAQPPDLSAFRKVCTNFHGRRGDRRLRNCHWLSWPECVRCLLLFSISLSISFEILSSVILAYPWVVLIFECPIILAMLSIDTLSEIRRTPNP